MVAKQYNKFHTQLRMAPYKAVFGIDCWIGVEKLNLNQEQTSNIETLKDVVDLLGEESGNYVNCCFVLFCLVLFLN